MDRYWEEFQLNDAGDEMLRMDEDGTIYDDNSASDEVSGDTRYRFRDGNEPVAASNWLFLQNISGTWHWWTWEVQKEGYHPLPQARSLEEAQALAIVEWRMK